MLKLTYSNLEFQNFPGRTPGLPSSRRGEGREGRRGRGKGRREGKDREGTGRDRGRKEGGRGGMGDGEEGRGGALDIGSAPLETSSGSVPWFFLFLASAPISKGNPFSGGAKYMGWKKLPIDIPVYLGNGTTYEIGSSFLCNGNRK